MTYAGLKSMIYAGLTANDPRVKAAFKWIRPHYSVQENPGMGQQGLLLLLPHVRQNAGRPEAQRIQGREGANARLAEGASRRVVQRADSPTEAGSTRRNAGWKGIPTFRRGTPCWP